MQNQDYPNKVRVKNPICIVAPRKTYGGFMLRKFLVLGALFAAICMGAPTQATESIQTPLGLIHKNSDKSLDGYTLFTPHDGGNYTYLY